MKASHLGINKLISDCRGSEIYTQHFDGPIYGTISARIQFHGIPFRIPVRYLLGGLSEEMVVAWSTWEWIVESPVHFTSEHGFRSILYPEKPCQFILEYLGLRSPTSVSVMLKDLQLAERGRVSRVPLRRGCNRKGLQSRGGARLNLTTSKGWRRDSLQILHCHVVRDPFIREFG